MDGPRLHHYLFAHRILPDFTLNQGYDFMRMIASDGHVFLEWIWSRLADDLQPDEHMEPVGLSHHTVDTPPWHAVLITLPAVAYTTEAHMVAVIAHRAEPWPGLHTYDTFRCFTLERGDDLHGTPRTVLCEWRHDAHLHLGDGPDPTPALFWRAILTHLPFDA